MPFFGLLRASMLLIVTFPTLLMSHSTHAQTLDCERFRNGTFELRSPDRAPYLLVRNNNVQVESGGENPESKVKFRVKWTDDCTYSLRYIKTLEGPEKPYSRDDLIIVRITETRENSYIQTTSMIGYELELTNEIFKVR